MCSSDLHGDVLLRIANAAAEREAEKSAEIGAALALTLTGGNGHQWIGDSTPEATQSAVPPVAAAAAVTNVVSETAEEVGATLAQRNPHSHDGEVLFEPKNHRYTLRNGGDECISVTTFAEALFPKFDADAVLDRMTQNASRWMSGKYAQMTTDQVKAKWAAAGEEAARLGTRMHEEIAKYYNGVSLRLPTEMDVGHFRKWDREVPVAQHWTAYRTEWAIVDPDLLLAGTIDALFRRPDGKFVLVDWKRCKKPIDMTSHYTPKKGFKGTPGELFANCNGGKYSIQLALYAYILRSRYDIDVDQLLLVRLHPNAASYEIQEVHVSVEDVGRLIGHRRRQVFGTGE